MRTQWSVAAAAALCMLAAGCGSIAATGIEVAARPSSTHTGGASLASDRGKPTEAGNRKLALAEARRLLSMAPVPAHATLLESAPSVLPTPAMGTPGVSSLADQIRSWRLAISFTAARAWLAAHPPARLQQAGNTMSSLRGIPTMYGYGYSGPANPAWASAELDVEVGPASDGGSFLRADGLVVWLDPVPVPDTVPGKRVHVLASGSCPASDDSVVGVTDTGADLPHRLVPAAQPRSGLVCRYYGLNGHPFKLRSQERLNKAQAARLAASMARIPLSHPVGGMAFCPMDDGSVELVALSYPGRADVDLWDHLGGCGGVANGYIVAGRI